jgi:hypothetical protein
MSASSRGDGEALTGPLPPNALVALGLTAAALLAIGLFLWPRAIAWGWLVGFLFWSSVPIGAIVLAVIHETTGGRWGLACVTAMRLGSICALLLPLLFAFLLAGLHSLYPWASGDAPASDVARFYLNVPAFALRGFIALIGYVAIGALAARDRLGLLGASIALVFHGFAVSLIAVDWGLSIDSRFSDSAFGAELAVQQIMLVLAVIAAFQPGRTVEFADGDAGGLLLAASAGAFYLGLMTFIVKWYGDQPVDAAWYLARAHGLWLSFVVGAVLFGAVAPIVALAWERVRASPAALRAVGVSVIIGVGLHDLWLAGPAAPDLAAPAALLAIVAMSGVSVGLAPRFERRLMRLAPNLRTHGGSP